MNCDKDIILKMEGITKSFAGVEVLKNVDFELKRGEIHALLGKNGAGKSTLMKIILGIYRKDDGKIFFEGKQLSGTHISKDILSQISMVFQELSLVPNLTVAQNIFLGWEPQKYNFLKEKELRDSAARLLEKYSIDLQPDELVENLSVGRRQLTEIAKVLSREPKIIILDEPTVSLTRQEIDNLFRILRQLKQKGISIIYITHYLKETFEICDRISVFRNGQKVGVYPVSTINNEQEIVSLMLGSNSQIGTNMITPENPGCLRERVCNTYSQVVLLETCNIYWRNRLSNVCLKLHENEILGLAGLIGSGRTELAKLLFGVKKPDSGTILLNNKPVTLRTPKDALERGIALVPENRREDGLHLMHSVADNIVLPIITKLTKAKVFLNKAKCNELVHKQIEGLGIVTPSTQQKVVYLSGGNQQKVLIGKWLTLKPKILILDEPFVGVDVGAKAEIKKIITRIAESGVGVIIISSDMGELVDLVDRVLVFSKGKTVLELSRDEITSEEVLQNAIQ